MPGQSDLAILGPEVVRMLSDGKADVRKRGAAEVDRRVQTHRVEKDWGSIHTLIRAFKTEFTHSVQPSLRKGGLLALSAVAIALKDNISEFVHELVEGALDLFHDQDASVRYHAAECLYNVAKVARGQLLSEFSSIFTGLCNLHADNDTQVQRAACTLDGILKDIAAESKEFDVDVFIHTVKQHITTSNPPVRQFVLSWLVVLDTVPDLDLVQHLPDFLGGVFTILSDPIKEIVGLAEKVLNSFVQRLQEMVNEGKTVAWGSIIPIVIEKCKSKDDKTRGVAVTWVVEVLGMAKAEMLPFTSSLITAILPCVADREESIRVKANMANDSLAALLEAAQTRSNDMDKAQALEVLPAVFHSLTVMLANLEVATRSAALQWLHMVLERNPGMVESSFDSLFPVLLQLLGDPSDQVVELNLQVLALITKTKHTFEIFLTELVNLLQHDNYRLMSRAATIVKHLSNLTRCDDLYRTLAGILCRQEDLGFVSSLVTTLNMLLLTSPELIPLRETLKKGLHSPDARGLFTELYYCWSYNAVSLISLCLLAKAYEHAYVLIRVFGEMDVTVSVLVQIDKLVQLLESPVFSYLRLALLEPTENPYLIKALFGLLMLLPQSAAFDDLHKRLKSVNTLCNMKINPTPKSQPWKPSPKKTKKPPSKLSGRGDVSPVASDDEEVDVDWDGLLQHYRRVEATKVTYYASQQAK